MTDQHNMAAVLVSFLSLKIKIKHTFLSPEAWKKVHLSHCLAPFPALLVQFSFLKTGRGQPRYLLARRTPTQKELENNYSNSSGPGRRRRAACFASPFDNMIGRLKSSSLLLPTSRSEDSTSTSTTSDTGRDTVDICRMSLLVSEREWVIGWV